MISISVNGEFHNINDNTNISQLLLVLNYGSKGFSVAVNSMFVAISEYENVIIKNGDTVDILAPVQGG